MKYKMNLGVLITSILYVSVLAEMDLTKISPKIIIGDDSGVVRRCKYSNVSDCETLSSHGSAVSALAVAGEFMYVGLRGGRLRRCPLFHASNCTTFHTLRTDIYDISVHGTHLYLATAGGIFKCGLRKTDNCEMFHKSESSINSLTVFEDKLYAGSDSFLLVCPLIDSTNCTVFTNSTSEVTAMAFYGRNLYIVVKEGLVQQCALDNLKDCDTLFETQTEIKAMNVFDGNVQTVLESGEILRYDLHNETTIFLPGNHTNILSMFTTYATTPLKRHFVGEDHRCIWQRRDECPPYVVYYDAQSRAPLELRVRDGKLYTTTGDVLERSGHGRSDMALFVMDASGRLFASTHHPVGLVHQSSLLAGKPVAAAGLIAASNGTIGYMLGCSAHYRVSVELTQQVVDSLKRQGYDNHVPFYNC